MGRNRYAVCNAARAESVRGIYLCCGSLISNDRRARSGCSLVVSAAELGVRHGRSRGMTQAGATFFSPPGEDLAVLDLPRPRLAALFAFRHWILETARAIPDTSAIVSGVGERFLA